MSYQQSSDFLRAYFRPIYLTFI